MVVASVDGRSITLYSGSETIPFNGIELVLFVKGTTLFASGVRFLIVIVAMLTVLVTRVSSVLSTGFCGSQSGTVLEACKVMVG